MSEKDERRERIVAKEEGPDGEEREGDERLRHDVDDDDDDDDDDKVEEGEGRRRKSEKENGEGSS